MVQQKGFKGNHKIQDKWENTPYKVVEQKDPNLTVFLVKNTENPTKSRVLDRNMLFPLLNRDLDQNQFPRNEISQINISDEESECLDPVEQPYIGPMTCSRAKGTTTPNVDVVMKANTLMEQHFGIIGEAQEYNFNPDYPDLFAHIEAGFLSI